MVFEDGCKKLAKETGKQSGNDKVNYTCKM